MLDISVGILGFMVVLFLALIYVLNKMMYVLKDEVHTRLKPHIDSKVVDILHYGDSIQIEYCNKYEWCNKRDLALLTLIYGCGLRISEALNVTKKDILNQDNLKDLNFFHYQNKIHLHLISPNMTMSQ